MNANNDYEVWTRNIKIHDDDVKVWFLRRTDMPTVTSLLLDLVIEKAWSIGLSKVYQRANEEGLFPWSEEMCRTDSPIRGEIEYWFPILDTSTKWRLHIEVICDVILSDETWPAFGAIYIAVIPPLEAEIEYTEYTERAAYIEGARMKQELEYNYGIASLVKQCRPKFGDQCILRLLTTDAIRDADLVKLDLPLPAIDLIIATRSQNHPDGFQYLQTIRTLISLGAATTWPN